MEENKLDTVSSYIIEEDHILSVPSNYSPDEKGLGNLFFRSMRKHGNSVAQYIAETGGEDTYNQLLERCIRTALHIQAYNLDNDDIIMLCTYNHKNSCVPFIAGLFLTLQVASLDPTLSVLDTTHLLKEVQPKILFVAPEAVSLIEESLSEAGLNADIIVFGESDKYGNFDDFLRPHIDEERFLPLPVKTTEDPAVIFFSSGTTGLPKGIVINHYTLGAQTYNFLDSGTVGPILLIYSSLYWISGVLFLSNSVISGAARVVCTHFDPNEIWFIIDKFRVASLLLAPTAAISMLKAGRPEGIDTTSLWSVIIGGAPISERHLRELRDQLPGTFVFQGYGQSEVAGPLTLFKTNIVKETLMLYYKPNSVGTPVAGLSYKVIDNENQNVCGPYEQGELRIQSKVMMNGYYKRDSSETFDSEGWLRTGDIVYYDEQYCFYVVDRLKEILKFKSWHISPVMVEKILLNHPAIQQAVVIGIPHPEDGDHPMAVIVPLGIGEVHVTEEEIEEYVANRAPDRMKLRGGVKFLESLPVTPSGKLKRKEIRNMILLNHPAIQQAVVIGIPHPEDGDHPMAVIVPLNIGEVHVTEEEIEEYVANRAPDRMKLRGGVKFLESLPVTPSGKLKRKEIRNMVLSGEI